MHVFTIKVTWKLKRLITFVYNVTTTALMSLVWPPGSNTTVGWDRKSSWINVPAGNLDGFFIIHVSLRTVRLLHDWWCVQSWLALLKRDAFWYAVIFVSFDSLFIHLLVALNVNICSLLKETFLHSPPDWTEMKKGRCVCDVLLIPNTSNAPLTCSTRAQFVFLSEADVVRS